MNMLLAIWATFTFELHRAFHIQRIVYGFVLASFPPAIVLALGWGMKLLSLRSRGDAEISQALSSALPGILIVLLAIVCLLALLLWATTNVNSELEGKTWIFSAVRTNGRLALFLGKYLASVALSFMVCQVAIVLSLLAMVPGALPNRLQDGIALSILMLLSCCVYGATLSLVGVMFYRRAMVIGAGYLILVELILPNVPSLICNFTARRHLFDLAIRWIGWFLPGDDSIYRIQYGWHPLWVNLAALAAITAAALFLGGYWIRRQEYVTAEDT